MSCFPRLFYVTAKYSGWKNNNTRFDKVLKKYENKDLNDACCWGVSCRFCDNDNTLQSYVPWRRK